MDAEIEAMKMILDVDNGFVLSTESMRKSEYSRTKMPIIKPKKFGWSVRLLSSFINELTNWIPDTNNGGRKRSRLKSSSYNFFKYFSKENENFFIIINIDADQINVKASKDWIDSWINDEEEEEIRESWVKYNVFIKFSLSASKAIYCNSSLLFYPEDEFSPTFRHFASSFVDKKIADLSEDTSPIFNYYDSFIHYAIYENISIEELKKTTEGYLYLELNTSNNTGKKLDICHIDSKPYYILSGTYFSPFIMNLVQDNLVNGIQLDTTWSVLQQYVTSIPTVIVKGVGIPIGFQFSLFEDAPIYYDFFDRFEKVFGFKINDYISVAQSDQGTALVSAVESLNMRHIYCLRHLLASLKKSKFRPQISKFVSAISEKDYEELKERYEDNWKTLNADDTNELNKYLSKIGLLFQKNKIKVQDPFKWENCSMQKRAAFKMPSCTNQIESGHGHLNAAIPRRNSFFSSVKRLIDAIIKRNKNFYINFNQHYASHKRKIRNIIKSIPDEVMASAIKYYQTDQNRQICKCGESILISSEMDTHIPCSHLLYLGIDFPEIEAPKLKYQNTFQGELIFEHKINSSPKIQINTDYFSRIRTYVYKTIKRNSCNKNKDEIISYVQQELPFDEIPKKFILGYPAEIFSVIDKGIRLF